MSIITDFLKLFKYDPETDGASAFNIKQCLNDNWDKIDAWASGIKTTIAGLVPGTRKVNGKELSADVTLTGEDIKTSASDETTISSQLSNRLRRYTSFEDLGLTEATATVASIVTAMGNNSMFAAACATDGKTAGWLPESYGFLRIHKVNNYYAMAEYQVVWPNAELWRGYYNAGDDGLKWSGWQPIATATPPQEFNLPLADGWSGWAKYSKDQFGRVLVYGLVAKSTALLSGDVIGTFPEGFRPSQTCPMTITSNNSTDGKSFATSGYVQPSGVFTLTNGIISSGYNVGNNIAFNFVFPAAS